MDIRDTIRKYMGCFGELKERPGGLKDDLDEQLCVTHKTNDFI